MKKLSAHRRCPGSPALLAAVLVLTSSTVALAQSNVYSIARYSLSAATRTESTGGGFSLRSTVGTTGGGDASSGGGFSLVSSPYIVLGVETPGEPSARNDLLLVPDNGTLTIPTSALLGNDTHLGDSPFFFSGHDAVTALGNTVTDAGSPATALSLPSPPPLPPGVTEDTFTYRISDGTHEATGTVHLVPVAFPTAPPNKLAIISPAAWSPTGPLRDAGSVTIPFSAPAAGTYALERKNLAIPGTNSLWSEVVRQTTSGPSVVAYIDLNLPAGALYRVRKVP